MKKSVLFLLHSKGFRQFSSSLQLLVRICLCVAAKSPRAAQKRLENTFSESPSLCVRLELFWLFHPCFEEVGAPQGKGYVMSVHQSGSSNMLVLSLVTAGGLLSFVSSQLQLNLIRTAPLKQG